jgi:ParB family transcriptional regulator, chromosome partitioning protein
VSRSTLVHISSLDPHPANIREDTGDLADLAASIRAHGIVQPLVVQRNPQRQGHFLVIAGHRRLAAARKARLNEVPVLIRDAEISVAQATEVMLVENCQRRDLDPVEKARAMGSLRARGYTAAAIAKAIGMTDATVSSYLALLELDDGSLERIRAGSLPVADAVQAVRKTRARRRVKDGKTDQRKAMAATWEPDHFTPSHSLARRAAALCEAREHNLRRRLGKTACGQCWETVIRDDERRVVLALGEASPVTSVPFLAPAEVGA